MFFYIKEWPDKTATLMAKNGAVLWTFHSVEEAQRVCRDWYQVREESDDCCVDEFNTDGVSFDPTCGTCAVA